MSATITEEDTLKALNHSINQILKKMIEFETRIRDLENNER